MGCEQTADRQHGDTLPKKPNHKQKKEIIQALFRRKLRNIDTIENGKHDTRPAASREREGGRLSPIITRGGVQRHDEHKKKEGGMWEGLGLARMR